MAQRLPHPLRKSIPEAKQLFRWKHQKLGWHYATYKILPNRNAIDQWKRKRPCALNLNLIDINGIKPLPWQMFLPHWNNIILSGMWRFPCAGWHVALLVRPHWWLFRDKLWFKFKRKRMLRFATWLMYLSRPVYSLYGIWQVNSWLVEIMCKVHHSSCCCSSMTTLKDGREQTSKKYHLLILPSLDRCAHTSLCVPKVTQCSWTNSLKRSSRMLPSSVAYASNSFSTELSLPDMFERKQTSLPDMLKKNKPSSQL